MFKKSITNKLERYVRRYFSEHPNIKLVVVAGSVGKTSTKLAVATLLNEKYRVRLHEGNHNTHLSAPLAILGIDYPDNPRNFWQWHKVFKAARKRIKSPAEIEPEVIIQELGTDRPGDIEKFGGYLLPDLAIVTSVTPEHMEFFGTIDAVAREELGAVDFSKKAIINREDVASEFSKYITNSNISTYGTSSLAEYNFRVNEFSPERGYVGEVQTPNGSFMASVGVFGDHSLRPITGAIAAGLIFGLSSSEIIAGLAKIRPVPGRMNVLKGVNDSILIDDTYNSSPAAADAAIRAIYDIFAPSKIAIIGSMNELGSSSAEEHRKLGELCDPVALSWVITVGDEANKYLAPVAKSRGCQVETCSNALEAAIFAKKYIEPGSLILLKGSQGGIYLEEATKILLRDQEKDKHNLVRQDEKWLRIKHEFFNSFSQFEDDEV